MASLEPEVDDCVYTYTTNLREKQLFMWKQTLLSHFLQLQTQQFQIKLFLQRFTDILFVLFIVFYPDIVQYTITVYDGE